MGLNEKYMEIMFKEFLEFIEKQGFLDHEWKIASTDRLIQDFFEYQKFPDFESWDSRDVTETE